MKYLLAIQKHALLNKNKQPYIIGHHVQSLSCHHGLSQNEWQSSDPLKHVSTQIFLASTERLTRPAPQFGIVPFDFCCWNRRQGRVRRFSEPPRPDVVFDECEVVDYPGGFLGTQRLGTDWQITMSFFELMSLCKKGQVLMLSEGCGRLIYIYMYYFVLYFFFRMDFLSVAFHDGKGQRRGNMRHPCVAGGAGQMRKMWWVVVSDPPTRLR